MTSSLAAVDLDSKPFGTLFGPHITRAECQDGRWSASEVVALGNLALHPATHALHYGSTCFEGLKAYRWADGSTRVFRLDRHVARLQKSAALLAIPCPDPATIETMIIDAIRHNRDHVPEPPGSLYLRPTLIGTELNIGAAGSPSRDALCFVLTSPVGNYFAGGDRAVRILIDDKNLRAPPGLGQAKTGGNYAAALHHTIAAKRDHKADQVLFCPGGDVQETGASNFMLINDHELITKPLDDSFLHGVTRDSVLRLAERLQYRVIEKNFSIDDIFEWIAQGGEASLSGTAAVMTAVGTFIYNGQETPVRDGRTGRNTARLRDALQAVQHGRAEDVFGWTQRID